MKEHSTRRTFFTLVVVLTLTLFFTLAPEVLGETPAAEAYPTATSFRYPLDPGGWFLIQGFGAWNTWASGFHLAEDLYTINGRELPVYAPANGRVRHSGFQSGYGYVVVIEHRLPDNSYVCSVLGHLKRQGLIALGTEVSRGQLIGYVSNNPRENGGYNFAHLHFGIRSGPYSTVRDPDGRWRYRGYTPYAAIRDLWHHPTDFISSQNSPPVSPPELNVSRTSLNFGFMARWRYSGAQTYRVTGTNLTGNVTIEAPPGFWISLTSAGGYAKTLTLSPASGTVNRTIYVRFFPTRTGIYRDAITTNSPGAPTRNISVSGWAY